MTATVQPVQPAVSYRLSEFGGTTDDDRAAAFASHAAAQTFRGSALVLDEPRTYRFTRPLPIYDGFAVVGPGRPVDQGRSEMPIPNSVRLDLDGGWLRLTGKKMYGVYIAGLSLDGRAKARLFEPAPTVLWTTVLRDISSQNIASLLGSKTVRQLVDFLVVDGFGNWNNFTECAWNLGGSDCFIRPSGMNLDSPPHQLGPTEFLSYFTAFGQSTVEGVYWTAEQHSAIKVAYNNEGDLTFTDCVMMGRNANLPCYGALIRIEGGDVLLDRCKIQHGMANPRATGRNDAGNIHITGGNVSIRSCQYRRAAGVAESVPFVYVSGGKVDVSGIRTCGRDTWAGKPVVVEAGGKVTADTSVTVVRP